MTTAQATSSHRLRRRCLFVAVYLLFLGGLAWAGLKAYWWIRFGVQPAASPDVDTVWTYYYPELSTTGVLEANVSADDRPFDVLLLGGSVLEQVSHLLEARLKAEFDRPVRLFSLAISAHTSRDSLLKFERVKQKPFDLIVVYHGINDVRMNCCPPGTFQKDYTHCQWYESMMRRVRAGKITLAEVVADHTGKKIPLGEPDQDHLRFGSEIKTGPPFRQNLRAIVSQAQTVCLMTFAYHLPEDYTRERFENRELDYGPGRHHLPAEIWGLPENVAATIDVHNQAVRELAESSGNVIFVDQAALVPSDGQYFSDPCHLTDEGCRIFVKNLLDRLNQERPRLD